MTLDHLFFRSSVCKWQFPLVLCNQTLCCFCRYYSLASYLVWSILWQSITILPITRAYEKHVSKRTLRTKYGEVRSQGFNSEKHSAEGPLKLGHKRPNWARRIYVYLTRLQSALLLLVIPWNTMRFFRGLDYPKIMMAAIRKQWEEECALITGK